MTKAELAKRAIPQANPVKTPCRTCGAIKKLIQNLFKREQK